MLLPSWELGEAARLQAGRAGHGLHALLTCALWTFSALLSGAVPAACLSLPGAADDSRSPGQERGSWPLTSVPLAGDWGGLALEAAEHLSGDLPLCALPEPSGPRPGRARAAQGARNAATPGEACRAAAGVRRGRPTFINRPVSPRGQATLASQNALCPR